MHRFIKINQEGWLEPYINMDEKLRKAKNDFEKEFFKLKDNGKTMENVRKDRYIQLVTTKAIKIIWYRNQNFFLKIY